ncbi:hypothetical protein CIW83_03045 [Tissierella sp. P1]|uniref:hypothetical protein n=1 Tax=Tissierella sp. P1 TaxID=1280483 RepID=UPI000BA14017|nr:hypothetical protein [Tissierella sp. P1]OZV13537.1 hypothetical protein CIW83_03045 [Tissierella sp. P1]
MIIEVDNYRLLHSFEAIGRGLYFHNYNKQFTGICNIVPVFIRDKEKNTEWNNFCDLCVKLTESERKNWTIKGDNPDIFKYQFGKEDEVGCQMLIMTFYNNLEVYISFANSKAIDILRF